MGPKWNLWQCLYAHLLVSELTPSKCEMLSAGQRQRPGPVSSDTYGFLIPSTNKPKSLVEVWKLSSNYPKTLPSGIPLCFLKVTPLAHIWFSLTCVITQKNQPLQLLQSNLEMKVNSRRQRLTLLHQRHIEIRVCSLGSLRNRAPKFLVSENPDFYTYISWPSIGYFRSCL